MAFRLQDIEAIDPTFYKSLQDLLKYPLEDMGIEMEFTADRDDFGTVRTVELIPGGANIPVTDQNKLQYVQMLAAHRMTSAIKVRRRRRRRRVCTRA